MAERLLKCQAVFKTLSDEILQEKPNTPHAFFGLGIDADPEEILARLKVISLRDMLLKGGESFSTPEPNEQYPDLNLIAETPAHSITLIHGDWQEPKYRYDSESHRGKLYRVKHFPGEYDWTRQIAIRIWFGDGKAAQELFINDCLRNAGLIPDISRAVFAPSYIEQGYEGHNQKHRRFKNQQEAMFFVNLARELFEKRVK